MDVNIRLENDPILFLNSNDNKALVQMLNAFHNMGIYTVSDLINYDDRKFSQNNKKKYRAIVQVLKHAYLGQDLVFDVLFEKQYNNNETGIEECVSDMEKMGFAMSGPYAVWGRLEIFLYNYKEDKFSMEYVLKNCYDIDSRGPSLRQYYVQYIDEKKKKKQDELLEKNIPGTLEYLRKQLLFLMEMRNNVDEQIKEINEQIKLTDKGGHISGER